jgi:ADP-dependent NAD(P)H-hydrate dehydratase / NAD(P)H-hydrate epimerase
MIITDHHHRVFRASEIRSLDEAAIRETGIPGDVLMEIAGFQAAKEIMQRQNGRKRGLIVCGKGNNAGDALVVARYLSRNGYHLTLFFAGGREGLSPGAATNYERLKKSVADFGNPGGTATLSGQAAKRDTTGGAIHGANHGTINETGSIPSIDPRDLDFAVDGLFGTGLSKEIKGTYREAIARMNSLGVPIYAMDIPSGLDADTGEVHGIATTAAVTCTFGGYKHGFYTPEGFRCCGDVVLCELPFAPHLYPADGAFAIGPGITRLPAPEKMNGLHKYDRGIVYILGGSHGLTGAPVLSAKAAWNTGTGAVVVITPAGLLPVFEKNLIEPVKKQVGRADDYCFGTSHTGRVLEIIHEKPGILLLGPGIGRNNETVGFVNEVIRQAEVPMVIDADGLWCLSQTGRLPVFNHKTVLTPHPGELQQLTGKKAMTNLDRLEQASMVTDETGAVTVAKGCPLYVTGSASGTFVTAYDTTVFGRAGFGDVLAGKIAGAMATGHNTDAAVLYALIDGISRYRKAASPDLIPGPTDIL